ncbi:MAG: hypothetical protein ACXVQU_00295 [Actinomycetota bacterium]
MIAQATTTAGTCVGFHIDCQTLLEGGIGVAMGFVLFIGSVLLLLSAVFGRRMGYLILATCFFAWMIVLASLWTFGFYSQGPSTPVDLGPRGAEPAWVVEAAGQNVTNLSFPQYKAYPDGQPWQGPRPPASVQSVTGAIQSYLAEQANVKAGKGQFEPGAFQTTDFTVQNIEFAQAGNSSLAAAQAFYNGGGPTITLYMRHDSGSVPHYSWMFLIGSIVLFAVHLPFLDRAERKRKEILTGGTAPPWYGPA